MSERARDGVFAIEKPARPEMVQETLAQEGIGIGSGGGTGIGAGGISVEAVTKRFGALTVLNGISLSIRPGLATAVLGPSGSGKSTLVRCVNCLERIQDGRITVGGTAITARGPLNGDRPMRAREIARFRARIGLVFQSFNLFPHLTVLGNLIEAPVGVLGRRRDDARAMAMDLLARVNLAEKADDYPARLSGGQQQRVAIARALMMDPPFMLFDEPTSALDPELTGEVLKVIGGLAIRGRTSVIVTHEVGFARDVADWVIIMDGGRVIEEGPPASVIDNPATERARAFLGRLHRHGTMREAAR
jgi:polar amino acid transport system ATP-binding protein